MGMSASQGRFLELTARKSNVEYQGQQVNQQRTVLSNQSASLNSQMLNLKVPTPPSKDQFTKLAYTTSVNGKEITLYPDTLTAEKTGGTYTLKYSKVVTGAAGVESTKDNAYTALRDPATGAVTYQASINGTVYPLTKVSDAGITQTVCDGVGLKKGEDGKYPTLYTYTVGDTVKYLTQASLDNCATENFAATTTTPALPAVNRDGEAIQSYEINQNSQTTITDYFSGVHVAFDDGGSGRISTIDIGNGPLAVKTAQSTDDAAYEDAMNQYYFDQSSYEQTLNEINAKTSVIQQQDKGLELQLKQLDTEQSAISTEIDAVKKVISKNVESSFKTFNA